MATKIVLAEDDEILAKVLREELSDAGFEIFHAADGEEAVKLVQGKRPNLVLCDVLMPKKDGFAVLEEIKKSPVTTAIPVIMLTMLGRDDDIKKGFQLGANDYIVKSQHAVAEICDKVKEFFGKESHPEGEQPRSSSSTGTSSDPQSNSSGQEGSGQAKGSQDAPEEGGVIDLRKKK